MPVINLDGKAELNEAMRAIWGTRERMETSPLYKEVVERQEYLRNIVRRTHFYSEREIKNIKWWNLADRLLVPILRFSVKKILINPAEELIAKYERHKTYLLGFSVGLTNDEFTALIKTNKKIILQINKYEGIESDPYLK